MLSVSADENSAICSLSYNVYKLPVFHTENDIESDLIYSKLWETSVTAAVWIKRVDMCQ